MGQSKGLRYMRNLSDREDYECVGEGRTVRRSRRLLTWIQPDLVVPIRARPKPRDGRYKYNKGKHSKTQYFKWKNSVQDFIDKRWSRPIFTGPLYMNVAYLSVRQWTADEDNLRGGILDACQGPIYKNDLQVIGGMNIRSQWKADAILIWVVTPHRISSKSA